jgi:hypothetical protein
MKKTTLTPDPISPTPGVAPARLTFEWTQYEYGGGLNEYDDPEVIDVTREYSAEIIEPEPGKVLESRVLLWRHQHEGRLYAIIKTMGGYSAIRTDVHLPPDRDQWYQMRPVVLDEPNRPWAWEVLRQNRSGLRVPVEGQHLRPRSATSTNDAAHG